MMRRRFAKSALAVVFSMSLFVAAGAAEEAKLHSAVKPVPVNSDWWMARHKKMNDRVKQGNVDLLLIGDSITHGWEGNGKAVWGKYYGKRNAVNLASAATGPSTFYGDWTTATSTASRPSWPS